MRNIVVGLVLSGALMLAGCGKGGSSGNTGQAATVTLKDGGTFSGAVTKNDTSAITLTGASGETRTYPMSQVDSVQYTAGPAPGTAGQAPGAPPAAPVAAVRTLPAATTITVRNSDTIRAGAAQAGMSFPAVIVRDVIGADGGVVIPKGSDATLVVRAIAGARARSKVSPR